MYHIDIREDILVFGILYLFSKQKVLPAMHLKHYQSVVLVGFLFVSDVSKEGLINRDKPEDILFAWAVILNRKKLAFKFLELCTGGIGNVDL